MSITTVGDQLIHYEAVGRGEAIVFIHGWLGSWRYWWSSMQSLSTHYRTFAFDLWGYGDSSKTPEKYTFEAYVQMLDQFLDRLGILRPLTIVGHALGAAVGLRYAARKPEAVERLAVVALPLKGHHINSRLTETDAATFMSRVIGKSNSYPEVESELRKTDTQALNRTARELRSWNFTPDLKQLDCPLLLIWGERDPVIETPAGDLPALFRAERRRAAITLEG
ncbi:MAG: alpha/beta hydrolase, partial [Candidatus Promineifilaceae bacterium]|nr:alpha/beta hydrolase [Candidatus Promineifilaceae bacterium]